MSEEDDLIREALRSYAYAEITEVESVALQRRRASQRRRQWLVRVATAAVVLLIFSGVIAWIAASRPSTVPPIMPTPAPTPSVTATATPSPTPTPSPMTAYPEQPKSADELPSGGLGDTVDGLRLVAIDITDAECPDASRCPGSATLTVQNTTEQPIQGLVFFFVFRDNAPAVGDAQTVSLAPGG